MWLLFSVDLPIVVPATAFVVAGVAAAALALLVPRLPAPTDAEDGSGPNYAALATPTAAVGIFLATFAATLALWLVPPVLWPLWVPYLALGAPLVYVDLRTTYLPKRLNDLALCAMSIGLVVVALSHPVSALVAALGGVAFLGLFFLVWRFSRSFGFGDVRLTALVGAVAAATDVDPMHTGYTWFLAVFLGTFFGAIAAVTWALVRRRRGGHAYFAYGPWLWLGPVAAVALSGW